MVRQKSLRLMLMAFLWVALAGPLHPAVVRSEEKILATNRGNLQFSQTTIVIGVQDAPAIGGPATEHAKSWQAKTGGKAVVKKYPFGELYNTLQKGISENPSRFDVILYASSWVGDYHDYLSSLPAPLTQSELFDDVHTTYRERLMLWDGKWIAVTVDGDLFNGYYRKDLFGDTNNKKLFKHQYGYQLSPPVTWKEYRDISHFFTSESDKKENSTTDKAGSAINLYGTSEPFAYCGEAYWDLFSRVINSD